jgi:hypothetical protein
MEALILFAYASRNIQVSIFSERKEVEGMQLKK